MRDAYDFSKGVIGKYAGKITLPGQDYCCGASFCDDPACNQHGAKDADGALLYWTPERVMRKQAETEGLKQAPGGNMNEPQTSREEPEKCPHCGSTDLTVVNTSSSKDPLFSNVVCAACGQFVRCWNSV